MQITMSDVHVRGRRAVMLELGGLTLTTGQAVLLAGEPGQGLTALALAATGRLSPFDGTVTLVDDDGATTTDPAELRRVTAVVDLPGVSEPDDAVPLGTVVAEDLALARVPAGPGATRRWLAEHDLSDRAGLRVDDIPGDLRTELLATLAAERPDVRFLVLTMPERHGGEPARWWQLAQELAALGYGVLVQCSRSCARDLGADVPPARSEADAPAPVEALRTTPPA
ncbi:hypothetical protein, partial [Actinotalea sp. JY-7885]